MMAVEQSAGLGLKMVGSFIQVFVLQRGIGAKFEFPGSNSDLS